MLTALWLNCLIPPLCCFNQPAESSGFKYVWLCAMTPGKLMRNGCKHVRLMTRTRRGRNCRAVSYSFCRCLAQSLVTTCPNELHCLPCPFQAGQQRALSSMRWYGSSCVVVGSGRKDPKKAVPPYFWICRCCWSLNAAVKGSFLWIFSLYLLFVFSSHRNWALTKQILWLWQRKK